MHNEFFRNKKIFFPAIALAGIAILFFIFWVFGGEGGFPLFALRDLLVPASSEVKEGGSDVSAVNTEELKERYEHAYGFSFEYPRGMRIELLEEGEGEILLVEDTKNSARDFQMYVFPFDEEGPLTPERIKKDVPRIVMENPLPVLIGNDKKIQALIFFGNDKSIGKTREIWFIAKGYFFQVTAAADADAHIGPIMDSFTF